MTRETPVTLSAAASLVSTLSAAASLVSTVALGHIDQFENTLVSTRPEETWALETGLPPLPTPQSPLALPVLRRLWALSGPAAAQSMLVMNRRVKTIHVSRVE